MYRVPKNVLTWVHLVGMFLHEPIEYDDLGYPKISDEQISKLIKENKLETQTNIDPKIQAGKQKIRFDLLDPEVELSVAKVFTHGAEKYGDRSYRNASWDDIGIYYGAIKRHLNAIMLGEFMDKDSGEPHTSHIIANSQIIYEIYNLDVPTQPSFLEAEIAEAEEREVQFEKKGGQTFIKPSEQNNTLAEQQEEQSPTENNETVTGPLSQSSSVENLENNLLNNPTGGSN